eukprot:2054680-Prymnesium_polylepis.2
MQTCAAASSSWAFGPTRRKLGLVKKAARLAVYVAPKTRTKRSMLSRASRIPAVRHMSKSSPASTIASEWYCICAVSRTDGRLASTPSRRLAIQLRPWSTKPYASEKRMIPSHRSGVNGSNSANREAWT